MADHVLEMRFWLSPPRARVFELFADPRHLALVQPESARLRWLAPPPGRLEAGSVLDFSVRILGGPGPPAPLPRGPGAGRRAGPRRHLGGGPPHLPAAGRPAGPCRRRALRGAPDRAAARSPRAPAAGAPRWLISWAP